MSKAWWKAAGIRAIKTIAQTAVATIGTSAVLSSVDWENMRQRVTSCRRGVTAYVHRRTAGGEIRK